MGKQSQLPIPNVKQMNTFTYDQWYTAYYKEIRVLYQNFKAVKHTSPLFDKMTIQDFVDFVYQNSSHKIPQWYYEERFSNNSST